MTFPVKSLDQFSSTYLAFLQAGDAQALGALYAEGAVLTSIGGPDGNTWAVGRHQIVAALREALTNYTVLTESPPSAAYELRGTNLAARYGRFTSTIQPKAGGPAVQLSVDAFEVLRLSPIEGWQYLADQSQVLPPTTSGDPA